MEFTELLKHRACVRSYEKTTLTQAQLKELLEAGIRAPNACNLQSWYFYAVADREKIDGVKSGIAHIPWAEDVPLLIVVCVKNSVADNLKQRFGERGEMFTIQDTAGAINHILLKAADMGLGGCWVGPMNVEKCMAHFGISKAHTPVGILTIGKPSGEVVLRDRAPLDESVTYIGALPSSDAPAAETVEKKPFSLKNAYLAGAVFDDLFLGGATFNNICLEGAKFTDINMTKTFYGGLNMSDSYFGCVDLNNATFENPCFDGAVFKNCSMKNVTFESCELEDATIDGISIKALLDAYNNK